MIAKLSGRIDSIGTGSLILDVGGVGYLVQASSPTLSALGSPGDAASLLIDMVVREDGHFLYGFADAEEQGWFRLLTGVQGVGARTALAILGACPPERLAIAIAAGDSAALRRADGVGPKLATRIVTELKDKAARLALGGAGEAGASRQGETPRRAASPGSGVLKSPENRDADAVSALVNLGYGPSEAFAAVGAAREKANENDKIDVVIRLALRELAG